MNLPFWWFRLAASNAPLNLLWWSVQISLLVLVAGLLPRVFQIRQPAALLSFWRVLLLVSVALPFVEPWRHPFVAGALERAGNITLATPVPINPPPAHWDFPSLRIVAPILLLVILAGAALRIALLALGLFKLRQFRRRSLPIAPSAAPILAAARVLLNIRGEFRLSHDVESPVTFGFASPVILLPERFLSFDPRLQNAIACHELLHVRRSDWVHHLAEETLRAFFWFHPAMAWLIGRIRLTREQVVDREVVRLTDARKTYLEALLAFTNARPPLAAIPAPPFLVERQLAERVSLMLKEVRMSRKRLIASFTAIAACLVLAGVFAVWAFPLRGAPRHPQAPLVGVTGGVAGGPSEGISGGISGGVSGGISEGIADEPSLDISTIWTDSVKRGPMFRQVRGLGQLTSAPEGGFIIRISLPGAMVKDVRADQHASVGFAKGAVANAHVLSVGNQGADGIVRVALEAPLPAGLSSGQDADVIIDIEKIDNILLVGRPVNISQNSTGSIFKIVNNGSEARKVSVKFGRASVQTIEILDGLQPGDKVILSDTASVQNADRIRLTDEKHLSKP
jgi:beta-lactamase regulating signal transducer with metallopeptidase domain